ncbi:hypothetical protein MMC21_002223 [Puttea exsequens]|nr:hypothetical protein [Puttea exsequens]
MRIRRSSTFGTAGTADAVAVEQHEYFALHKALEQILPCVVNAQGWSEESRGAMFVGNAPPTPNGDAEVAPTANDANRRDIAICLDKRSGDLIADPEDLKRIARDVEFYK